MTASGGSQAQPQPGPACQGADPRALSAPGRHPRIGPRTVGPLQASGAPQLTDGFPAKLVGGQRGSRREDASVATVPISRAAGSRPRPQGHHGVKCSGSPKCQAGLARSLLAAARRGNSGKGSVHRGGVLGDPTPRREGAPRAPVPAPKLCTRGAERPAARTPLELGPP